MMSNENDIQYNHGNNNNNWNNKGDNSNFIQGDNNHLGEGADEEKITTTQVVEILASLEEKILYLTALPEAERQKSINHLKTAKVEAQESEPNKNSIANSLKRVNQTLNEAGQTTEEVKELVKELFPTVVKVAGWLGYAAGKIWTMLP